MRVRGLKGIQMDSRTRNLALPSTRVRASKAVFKGLGEAIDQTVTLYTSASIEGKA